MPDASSAEPIVIEARNVSCCFYKRNGLRRKPHWVLTDVSLNLNRGDSLGVIGRNGAGKSTLLQLLAGIIAPTRGDVLSHGARATLLSLRTGMHQMLTGRDNAIMMAMLLGLRRRDALGKLDAIKSFSELGSAFEDPIHTYSTGMRARLGFSAAMALDPEVVLIDETLGVGDVAFREKSSALMRERIQSNRTVVLVSHSAPIIRRLCTRAIWLEGGRIAAAGEPDAVLEQYNQKMRVAGDD